VDPYLYNNTFTEFVTSEVKPNIWTK